MPNTLVHIGIQGLTTRAIIKNSDFIWIYIAVVIPDLPWILQRLVQALGVDVNPFDLRQYVIVQASFFFCILLSAALSSLTHARIKTFFILVLGSLVHLLIDATQIKWANGVHLFAPFDWSLLNFGWYWPDSTATYVFTVFGLVYFLIMMCSSVRVSIGLSFKGGKIWIASGIVFCYFALPLLFIDKPFAADNHYVKTLFEKSERVGNYVEFDRNKVFIKDGSAYLKTFSGEDIMLQALKVDAAGTYSIKGEFSALDIVVVKDFHQHTAGFRDIATYIGLLLIVGMLIGNVLGFKSLRNVKN